MQCFKETNNELHFKEELDLLKMSRFGKSAKHHNCIEVFLRSGPFDKLQRKHKFQFNEVNQYISFMKHLDKFTILKFSEQNRGKADSIESTSMFSHSARYSVHQCIFIFCRAPFLMSVLCTVCRVIMREENTTLDELHHARLYMNECPKGKTPPDFQFPDC